MGENMSEKACVVVEGMTDVAILRAALPTELLEEVSLIVAGGRSNHAAGGRRRTGARNS